LTFGSISSKVRLALTGAAPASQQLGKQQLRGETQKGLQLCGLWPTVWVPVTAASVD